MKLCLARRKAREITALANPGMDPKARDRAGVVLVRRMATDRKVLRLSNNVPG
jgi:hypothetical protein